MTQREQRGPRDNKITNAKLRASEDFPVTGWEKRKTKTLVQTVGGKSRGKFAVEEEIGLCDRKTGE
jgi:hypothetical protein